MNIFKKPNISCGWKCPICQTAEEKQIALIPIAGTQKDGLIECEQFHLGCLNLVYDKELGIIYQKIKDK